MTDDKHTPKKKPVLADHKRQGSRFIPPLQQLGMDEVSWTREILPELLWLGLLNHRVGLKNGAALAVNLAKLADAQTDINPKPLFAFASEYATLHTQHKNQIVAKLESTGELVPLQESLKPLGAYYPECPLNFLFGKSLPEPKSASLHEYKDTLGSLLDRWAKPATLTQANAVYIAFACDRLKVKRGLSLANFPAVADFPATEASKQVASGVRGTISIFFKTANLPTQWPIYFWNRGMELGPCEPVSLHDRD